MYELVQQPKRMKKLIWSDDEKRELMSLAGKMSVDLIADTLNKTNKQVINQMTRMGLSRKART